MVDPNEIRMNLRSWVATHMKLSEADVLIDELGFVNRVSERTPDKTFRADLALANGRLVAFEIKGGNDTLRRWPTQCEAYFRVFDKVWLCTHGKHLEKALAITPRETGIILTDDHGGLAVLREALPHKRMDAYDLSGLLWREELELLCLEYNIRFKKRDTKPVLRDLVSKALGTDSLRDFALQRLKIRKSK